jgi:hypothetical protein
MSTVTTVTKLPRDYSQVGWTDGTTFTLDNPTRLDVYRGPGKGPWNMLTLTGGKTWACSEIPKIAGDFEGCWQAAAASQDTNRLLYPQCDESGQTDLVMANGETLFYGHLGRNGSDGLVKEVCSPTSNACHTSSDPNGRSGIVGFQLPDVAEGSWKLFYKQAFAQLPSTTTTGGNATYYPVGNYGDKIALNGNSEAVYYGFADTNGNPVGPFFTRTIPSDTNVCDEHTFGNLQYNSTGVENQSNMKCWSALRPMMTTPGVYDVSQTATMNASLNSQHYYVTCPSGLVPSADGSKCGLAPVTSTTIPVAPIIVPMTMNTTTTTTTTTMPTTSASTTTGLSPSTTTSSDAGSSIIIKTPQMTGTGYSSTGGNGTQSPAPDATTNAPTTTAPVPWLKQSIIPGLSNLMFVIILVVVVILLVIGAAVFFSKARARKALRLMTP